MRIRASMIILLLCIVLHYYVNKTSDLTFIWCHNVWLQYFFMVVTTSLCSSSWYDNVHVCTLTRFVPYAWNKFRLMLSFSYFWVWHLSVLASFHVLSTDYVHVQLVYFFSFFPLSPRCGNILSYHLTLYSRCILSRLFLSPFWIQIFLLLCPC